MSKFSKKLDGLPSIVIGVVAVSALAFYSHSFYQSLLEEKSNLLSQLETSYGENYSLLRKLDDKEGIINSFQGQIGSIQDTVGVLEKLSKTDEELLKKYSKVYFLNENYEPATLADIDDRFVLKNSTNYFINAKVWPYLRSLFEEAHASGVELLSASAYRSFGTQSVLKSNYAVIYGSGANKFSADQGYSEHQLGTSVDFTTRKLNGNFSSFGSDPAYKWLLENAHKYGFILSYPEANGYYKFEPWHWRFVGVELAKKLHAEGRHFYDLDQREIDGYLIKLFD